MPSLLDTPSAEVDAYDDTARYVEVAWVDVEKLEKRLGMVEDAEVEVA